jgi:hypothetical protein
MDTPGDPRFLGRKLLEAAVQRQIFDPYTGDILDVRRAVLIDGTDHNKGVGMHVMTAANYDKAKAALIEKYGENSFDVYDGRELFGRGAGR